MLALPQFIITVGNITYQSSSHSRMVTSKWNICVETCYHPIILSESLYRKKVVSDLMITCSFSSPPQELSNGLRAMSRLVPLISMQPTTRAPTGLQLMFPATTVPKQNLLQIRHLTAFFFSLLASLCRILDFMCSSQLLSMCEYWNTK